MIDLNDVLLAMSNIPVDDPIAEIWGRGLQGGYKIIEYTGSLPITINANGDALIDYRIYGADGGVGERTENLFDPENLERGMINADGTIYNSNYRRNGRVSTYIDVTGASSVVLTQDRLTEPFVDQYMTLGCWDENKNFIANSRVFAYVDKNRPDTPISMVKQLPSGTKYIRCGVFLNYADDDIDSVHAMLNLGSVPLAYEPYGYKLPMTVSDGNTAQTVPVYIGENQLGEDEYVSFSEQKIYKDVSGTLTPTDPPVPFPKIPTIDGETVIDYDGTPKPSQMYVKYKGKG